MRSQRAVFLLSPTVQNHFLGLAITGRLQQGLVGLLICCWSYWVMASPLDSSLTEQSKIQKENAVSQSKITKISHHSTEILQEYRQVIDELQTLQHYNQQLEKLVRSQEKIIAQRNEQLAGTTQTERLIVPLMLRMIAILAQFIELDMPFLKNERRQQVRSLTALMDRADIHVSKKYQQILQTFLTEVKYGHTIEAYQSKHPNGDAVVDFLRIGRVVLLYTTLDRKAAYYWSSEVQSFKPLPTLYYHSLERGFRIARKQAAPEFLKVPISAPKHYER